MTGVASASEQLFVSRLARLPVRAPSGEMIGRIADVVIARAAPGSPPVVLGLTVWVQRRPIFIGMGRVRELDAGGATLSTGTVNLRPFELRAGETLVLGELVDSLVKHRETGREYRINDVAIGQVREGWVVCALDVIEPASGLRAWRRPPTCGRPTWRRRCWPCRPRPARTWPPGWTTTGWPRRSSSSRRRCRPACWPGSATSAPPTCSRRWTPTTPPTGRYLGVAHFQRLLRERPGDPLGSAIDTDLDALSPNLPTRRVAEYLATYDLLCAPVCDEQSRLLGAVSIDDVLDHLLPPAWRRGPVRARNGNGGNGNGGGMRNGGGGNGGPDGGAGDGQAGGEPMERVG